MVSVFKHTTTQLTAGLSPALKPFLTDPECGLLKRLKSGTNILVIHNKTVDGDEFLFSGDFAHLVQANEVICSFIQQLRKTINEVLNQTSETPLVPAKQQPSPFHITNDIPVQNAQIHVTRNAVIEIPHMTVNHNYYNVEEENDQNHANTQYSGTSSTCSMPIEDGSTVDNGRNLENNNRINIENEIKQETNIIIIHDSTDNQSDQVTSIPNNDLQTSEMVNRCPSQSIESEIVDRSENLKDKCEKNVHETNLEVVLKEKINLPKKNHNNSVQIAEQSTTGYSLRKAKSSSWVKKLLNTCDLDGSDIEQGLDNVELDSGDEYKPDDDNSDNTEEVLDLNRDDKEEEFDTDVEYEQKESKQAENEQINDKKIKQTKIIDLDHSEVDINPNVYENEVTVFGYKRNIGKMVREKNDPSMAKSSCRFCSFVNVSKYPKPRKQLQSHYSRNHLKRDLIYKCELCSKKFGLKSDLHLHKQLHMYKKCEHCGKLIIRRQFHCHAKRHKPDFVANKHECEICKKKYSSRFCLQQHVETMHNPEGRVLFLCEICKKVLSSKKSLAGHIQAVHGVRDKNHSCEICGKGFRTVKAVKSHQRVHEQNPQFVCDICCKAFRYKEGLRQHLKSHTDKPVKEFLCSYCGKSFTESYSLHQHVRIHTGERPFVCSVCSDSFNDSSILRRHMMLKHKKAT